MSAQFKHCRRQACIQRTGLAEVGAIEFRPPGITAAE